MRLEVADVIGKWLIGLAAIATVAVTSWKYLDQRDLEIDHKRLEVEALDRQSKQRFLDKQFELYTETVALAARLATGGNYSNRETDQARFWQLYWGELGLVEDAKVASAMKHFGDALKTGGDLQNRSLFLSRCVSQSIGANWGVELQTTGCPY